MPRKISARNLRRILNLWPPFPDGGDRVCWPDAKPGPDPAP